MAKTRGVGSEDRQERRRPKRGAESSKPPPSERARANDLAQIEEQRSREKEELQRQIWELQEQQDQAEPTIRALRSLLRITEDNPDPALRVATNGTILYGNPASASLCQRWNPVNPLVVPLVVQELVDAAHAWTTVLRREMTFGEHTYLVTVAAVPPDKRCVNIFVRDITARKQAEEDLRESEDRFRTLVTATSDVVYRMSPDWSEMRRLQGRDFLTDTERPSRTWLQKYILPEDQPHVTAVIDEAIRTKSIFELEHRVRRGDGTVGWTFSRAIPRLAANGEIIEWFGTTSDITERKRAEEMSVADVAAMTRLQQIGARFVRHGELADVLREILAAAIDITRADMGNVQLLDPKSGRLQIVASHGFERPYLDFWNRVAEGQGACGTALATTQRILVEDVTHSPIFVHADSLEAQREAGVRAVQSTPLIGHSGGPIGVLSTHWRVSHRPQPRELHLLDLLVQEAVDIVERAHAEEALREWNATLESKVGQRTAQLEQRARQLAKLTLEISETEDRERRRMAEILHDDLQQQLAATKFQVSLLRSRGKYDASLQEIAAEIDQMLKDAIEKSRSLSHELSPAVMHHGDLGETLRWRAGQVRTRHGLVVRVQTDGAVGSESESLKSFLYKAAQEFLFNVVKHAQVKEARLRVRRLGRCLYLSVSDRGRGFDPKNLREAAGFGLLSIRERVELLGGRMRIRSAPGQGSTFSIVVPDGRSAATNSTTDGGQE